MSDDFIAVEIGNPNNDQMLAQTKHEFEVVMNSVRDMVDQVEAQDADLASAVAVMALYWIDAEDVMTRERLASLLALATLKLYAADLERERGETVSFIRSIVQPETL